MITLNVHFRMVQSTRCEIFERAEKSDPFASIWLDGAKGQMGSTSLIFNTPEQIDVLMEKLTDARERLAAAYAAPSPKPVESMTREEAVAELGTILNIGSSPEPVGTFPRERCHTDGCDGKPEDRSMYCPECTAELLEQIPF